MMGHKYFLCFSSEPADVTTQQSWSQMSKCCEKILLTQPTRNLLAWKTAKQTGCSKTTDETNIFWLADD